MDRTPPKEITSFRGPNAFLSNFYPAPIRLFKRTFDSSEILYQALKSNENIEAVLDEFSNITNPVEAKRRGYSLPMKPNWDQIKESVMDFVVDLKFKQNVGLQRRLAFTQPSILIEGNMHHDNFYGYCYCDKCKDKPKLNILGKILMKKRVYYTSLILSEEYVRNPKMTIEEISNIYSIDRETAEFMFNCF